MVDDAMNAKPLPPPLARWFDRRDWTLRAYQR
jgi:hypothetical protein